MISEFRWVRIKRKSGSILLDNQQGVLYTNDVDYRLARLLADQVITEKPFMEISGETFQKALKAMESCDRVICTSVPVGSCNKRLGELIAAKKSRKVQFV